MNSKPIKIIVAGGGTAGHVFPALAVIEELKKQKKELQILYIGGRKGPERKLIGETKVFFIPIFSGKFRRYFDFRNFTDLFLIILGFLQSLDIILKFKPQVIFSKGGYVGLPVVLAGRILKIPCLIHESDAEMGLANKISARFVDKIALSYPIELFRNIPKEKIIFTGNPVRAEFLEKKFLKKGFNLNKKSSIANLRFDISQSAIMKLPIILITGGSQGAHKINENLKEILQEVLKISQVIHLTGDKDYKELLEVKSKLPEKLEKRYQVYNFLKKDMANVLEISDLIISRAGANILAEISILGKPAILIPLSGHQTKNALFYETLGAAKFLNNEKLSPDILKKAIKELIKNKKELRRMSQAAKSFAKPEAAPILAKEILKLTN